MKARVLFIDDNHSLSRIAVSIANEYKPEGVVLESAGYASVDVTPQLLEILSAYNIDCEDSLAINDVSNRKYDLVVDLSENIKSEVFPGIPPVIRWNFSSAINNENISQLTSNIKGLFINGFFNTLLQQRTCLTDVLNSLQDGIIAHDLKRKIFLFSRGAEILTGVNKEMVLGRDCHDLFKPHFCGDQCIFCNDDADYTKMPGCSYTALFNPADGSRKEFDVTRMPLRNEFGEVIGAIATIHDTTRIRQLESILGEAESFSGIIGQDYKMLELFDLIKSLAQSDFPVMITGESGTGKELVAAAVHKESNRRDRLFVPVNCGALPEGTLESELFGHVKGAFTGAIKDKKGRFELADKGTLFLDEIGELSLRMQVKLLRVLQEGRFEPLGSEQSKKVDVRVLCATNRNLKEMVREGTFRDDLYYRLAVVPVEVPPLRERRNDIALLAQHFLEKNSAKLNRGKIAFSEEALNFLLEYDWPGNVRQLQNAIQFSLIKCRGTVIMSDHLPPEITSTITQPLMFAHTPGKAGRKPKLTIEMVQRALEKAGGNKAKAARQLGVGRATLYNFINANPSVPEYT